MGDSIWDYYEGDRGSIWIVTRVMKGHSRSLDYSSYNPTCTNFHFIFHLLFQLILHHGGKIPIYPYTPLQRDTRS